MTPDGTAPDRALVDEDPGCTREVAHLKSVHLAYQILIDTSPQGLAILKQGRVVFANPRLVEIFGTTRAALLAASPADVRDCLGPTVLAHLAGGPTADPADPVQIAGPDGRPQFLKLRVDRMEYDGAAAHRLAVADVTEQVHLEMQLRQAQKLEAIGQLAAGIAHEINTPTQFVGDNLQFLGDAWGDLAPLLELVVDVPQSRPPRSLQLWGAHRQMRSTPGQTTPPGPLLAVRGGRHALPAGRRDLAPGHAQSRRCRELTATEAQLYAQHPSVARDLLSRSPPEPRAANPKNCRRPLELDDW